MTLPDLRLPPDARLVHIGPHKTGTTTVQGALHAARDRLLEHGVAYAGRSRHPVQAVLAAAGQPPVFGDPDPSREQWEQLLAAMEESEAQGLQVALSSEFFADADPESVARIAHEVGPRIHVVVTLRPLSRLLPSQWQQNVQSSLQMDYDRWLEHMLCRPPYDYPTPSFWRRHDHPELVRQWADAVGADNLTVIVLDPADHGMLLHCFEDLLGLPRDLLTPEGSKSNRSLTYGETEMIRYLNIDFKARDLPPQTHRLLRNSGMEALKREAPDPSDSPILTPRWAIERATEIGAEAAERIGSLGVRVVGDLSLLGSPGPEKAIRDDAAPATPSVTAQAAARALLGTMEAMEPPAPRPAKVDPETKPITKQPVEKVTAAALSRILVGRAGRAVKRRVRPERS